MSVQRSFCATTRRPPRPSARRRSPLAIPTFVLIAFFLSLSLASLSLAQTINSRHATTQGAATVSAPVDGFDFTRVVLALGVVIGLIFALKWGAKRFAPGGVIGGHSRAIQVVSRTVISPKQQLMLVKVGRRLVLVSNTSPAGMSPICEIRDEDEVSELLGHISAEKGDSVTKAFGSLFRREEEKFTPNEDDDAPSERIRKAPADENDEEAVAVSATRDELHGLMEKVRLVSKQFKRS